MRRAFCHKCTQKCTRGSTNRQADEELITELRRRSEGINFDEIPLPELYVNDIDITKAQELFTDIKNLNEKNLLTLKLLIPHQGKLAPSYLVEIATHRRG